MNLGGLSGLSSVYPGQQAAESLSLDNLQKQTQIDDWKAAQAGKAALGKTFQALMPGAQPMPGQGGPPPPQPGQASVPMQRPPAQPPMQGARPPGAPPLRPQPGMPPGAPPGQGGTGGGAPVGAGQFDLKTAAAAIARANPGIDGRTLVEALNQALPYLKVEAQQEVIRMRQQIQEQNLQVRRDSLDARKEAEEAREQQFKEREARLKEENEKRQGRFDAREQRLAAQAKVREDQGWQRLNQARVETERKIAAGDRTATMQSWRAQLDAEHKKATEIIMANSVTSGMDEKQRTKLLQEQQEFYNDAIKNMRNMGGKGVDNRTDLGPVPAAPGSKDQSSATSNKTIPQDLRTEFNEQVKLHPDAKKAMIDKLKADGYNVDGL